MKINLYEEHINLKDISDIIELFGTTYFLGCPAATPGRDMCRVTEHCSGAVSSMSDSKLTKKQKKGLAFRQRTVGKRRSRNELMEMETAAVPTMEDQDIASIQSDTLQDQKKRREVDETVRVSDQDKQGRVARKEKGTAEENNVLAVEVVKTIKRKRAPGEDGAQEDQTSESQSRKVLKRKKNNDVSHSSETKGKTAVKQRFILFIGSRFSCSL